MKFIPGDIKSWQDKSGYSKKILFDGKEIGYPGSLVQEVKIKSGETAKSHYHKIQTEIFYFLNDNGYWIVNNEKIAPKPGDILVIEPNDKHVVVNDTEQDYLYLGFKINYASDDSYRE